MHDNSKVWHYIHDKQPSPGMACYVRLRGFEGEYADKWVHRTNGVGKFRNKSVEYWREA